MSQDKKQDTFIELSKALIGCGGGIAAACITGVFALVAILAPRLPLFNETPTPTSTPGVAAATSQFGALVIAADVTADFKPIEAGTRFPEGVTRICALFPYAGMTPGTVWRDEWYVNGKLQEHLTERKIWRGEANGVEWVGVTAGAGLDVGQWEVRLYLGERLAQKAAFTIDKRAVGAPFFGTIHFAEDQHADKPVRVHQPDELWARGTPQVYAFFDAGNMPPGIVWRREWYRDGQLLADLVKEQTWDLAANESDYWVSLQDEGGLRVGTYLLKLYVAGALTQLGSFTIAP